MGRRVSDGKAFDRTVPAGDAVVDNELYRIDGINGLSIGVVDTDDVERTLAFEADPAAVYEVHVPAAVNPVAGAFLYWADPSAFQYGGANLQAGAANAGDPPAFFVTQARVADAAGTGYVLRGRILNGVTG